ncbi:MAG: serine/threonine-protein phosphatase [Spirochaetales bacterium]|nr:serine/threonine-protein phosphatase [Spirochaetales bacterium]
MFSHFFGRSPPFTVDSRLFLAAALGGGILLCAVALVLRPAWPFLLVALELLVIYAAARQGKQKRWLELLAALSVLLLFLLPSARPVATMLALLVFFLTPFRYRRIAAVLALCVYAFSLYPEITLEPVVFFAAFLALVLLVSEATASLVRRLENYRAFFEEDLTLARLLQKQILACSADLTSDYHFELLHMPAGDLSGDVYDISRPADTVLRIFLADARGHGVSASLSAMLIKSEWLSVNRADQSPAEILSRLNQRIIERYGDTVSLSAIILDIRENELTYASGGHLPQYILQKDELRELESQGPPPGMMADAHYEERTLPFPSPARLILFTDGLIEGEKNTSTESGLSWLKEILPGSGNLSVEDTARKLIKELAHRHKQDPDHIHLHDDLTLILLEKRQP